MLLEYIKKARSRPEVERQSVALALSLTITGVVVLIWLSILIAGHGLGHYRFSNAKNDTDPSNETRPVPGKLENLYPNADTPDARSSLGQILEQVKAKSKEFAQPDGSSNTLADTPDVPSQDTGVTADPLAPTDPETSDVAPAPETPQPDVTDAP